MIFFKDPFSDFDGEDHLGVTQNLDQGVVWCNLWRRDE